MAEEQSAEAASLVPVFAGIAGAAAWLVVVAVALTGGSPMPRALGLRVISLIATLCFFAAYAMARVVRRGGTQRGR